MLKTSSRGLLTGGLILLNLLVPLADANAQVNDECLRKAAALPALEEILIGGPTLTREGLLALAACKSLKKITLGQMKQVSADDIESLRQQRPDIQVIKR